MQKSLIMKSMREDGFLLLVEDMLMPVGEKAHQKGFIVLDTLQLKNLFSITSTDAQFVVSEARERRLKSHLIPKNCLKRITPQSRIEALNGICALAKLRIRELRKQPGSYQNGRAHGLWVQQLANAELALDELGTH